MLPKVRDGHGEGGMNPDQLMVYAHFFLQGAILVGISSLVFLLKTAACLVILRQC